MQAGGDSMGFEGLGMDAEVVIPVEQCLRKGFRV